MGSKPLIGVVPRVLGMISAETGNSGGAFGKLDSEWIIKVFWHLWRETAAVVATIKTQHTSKPQVSCQVLILYGSHLGLPNEVATGV